MKSEKELILQWLQGKADKLQKHARTKKDGPAKDSYNDAVAEIYFIINGIRNNEYRR